MFRSFFTQHIATEVDKELKRLKYGLQLLVDESDLLFLSKNLLETAKKQVQIEVIIVSNTANKSLKITNLLKRLVDSGVEVYWYEQLDEKAITGHYAIVDKSYIIATGGEMTGESVESLVRSKVDDFNQLIRVASPVQLYTGDITVDYTVDKTIVHKGESAMIQWDVKNAHTVFIYPDLEEVSLKGSELITVNKSVKYQLNARNSNSEIKRTIFIKVVSQAVINYTVEVYDPVLEEFIPIESNNSEVLKFGVYNNQKVRINWEAETEGKLVEQSLGIVSLNSSHEFIANKNAHFSFEFTAHDKKITTNLHFVTFEDISTVTNKLQNESRAESTSKIKKTFHKLYRSFLKVKR